MVEIIAEDLFEEELNKAYDYALCEFGRATVQRWQDGKNKIFRRLALNPEAYPPVAELYDVWPRFRGAQLMGNFKIIYHYSEEEQRVYVNDLWDMRQDPRRLKKRWKKYPVA